MVADSSVTIFFHRNYFYHKDTDIIIQRKRRMYNDDSELYQNDSKLKEIICNYVFIDLHRMNQNLITIKFKLTAKETHRCTIEKF